MKARLRFIRKQGAMEALIVLGLLHDRPGHADDHVPPGLR